MGRTWGEHGENMGRTWGEHGENMGRTWGEHGENMGRTWGEPGENLGRTWGKLGIYVTPLPAQTKPKTLQKQLCDVWEGVYYMAVFSLHIHEIDIADGFLWIQMPGQLPEPTISCLITIWAHFMLACLFGDNKMNVQISTLDTKLHYIL